MSTDIDNMGYASLGAPWKPKEDEDSGVSYSKHGGRVFQIMDDVVPAILRRTVLSSAGTEAIEGIAKSAIHIGAGGVASGTQQTMMDLARQSPAVRDTISRMQETYPQLKDVNFFSASRVEARPDINAVFFPGSERDWTKLFASEPETYERIGMSILKNNKTDLGFISSIDDIHSILVGHEMGHILHDKVVPEGSGWYHQEMNQMFKDKLWGPLAEQSGLHVDNLTGLLGDKLYRTGDFPMQVYDVAEAAGMSPDKLEGYAAKLYRQGPQERVADTVSSEIFRRGKGFAPTNAIEDALTGSRSHYLSKGIAPAGSLSEAALGVGGAQASKFQEMMSKAAKEGRIRAKGAVDPMAAKAMAFGQWVDNAVEKAGPAVKRFGRGALIGAAVLESANMLHNIFTTDQYDYSHTKAIATGALAGSIVTGGHAVLKDHIVAGEEMKNFMEVAGDIALKTKSATSRGWKAAIGAGKNTKVGKSMFGALAAAAGSKLR